MPFCDVAKGRALNFEKNSKIKIRLKVWNALPLLMLEHPNRFSYLKWEAGSTHYDF